MSEEQRGEMILWSSTIDNGKWKAEVVQSSETEATLYITKMPASVEYMETFDFTLDYTKGITDEALEEWQDKAIMWIDKQDEHEDTGLIIPEDARIFADGIIKIFGRMSDGLPRTLNFDKGWYGLIIDLDEELERVRPDYKIRTIKEKGGRLLFNFELPRKAFTCCELFHETQVPPEEKGEVSVEWWMETNKRLQEHLETEEHKNTLAEYLAEQEELQPDIDEMTNIIEEYADKSVTICEACGSPGELDTIFWHKTLCPKHFAELEKITPEDVATAKTIQEVVQNANIQGYVESVPKDEALPDGKFIDRF